MTELGDRLTDIITGMAAMPSGVAREVAERLPDIMCAITADIIEHAAIMLAFSDLEQEDVVLSITIGHETAHLDVSTNAEQVVVSHGYDMRIVDGDAEVTIDRNHRLSVVDHTAIMGRQIETTRATAMVERARALMRTHKAFKDMA